MGRKPRSLEIIDDEVGTYHITSRCVRRAFLMGEDALTGKSYDNRRDWLVERLRRYSPYFCIDIISFSIMANHVHLILRNRPDLVEAMSDEELIRTWWAISPTCRNRDGSPGRLTEDRLGKLLQDEQHIERCRQRLSSISWLMRYLKHRVAIKANAEDERSGHFFEGRFRVERIETMRHMVYAILYGDLNPIRAGIARSILDSHFTSGRLRLIAARERRRVSQILNSKTVGPADPGETADATDTESPDTEHLTAKPSPCVDAWLSPIEMRPDEPVIDVSGKAKTKPRRGTHMDQAARNGRSVSGLRASDRGVLPMSDERYLLLLDFVGRREAQGKRGKIPAGIAPILRDLGVEDVASWLARYDEFAAEMADTYLSKVNDEQEAAMVILPLVDATKSNQDALM